MAQSGTCHATAVLLHQLIGLIKRRLPWAALSFVRRCLRPRSMREIAMLVFIGKRLLLMIPSLFAISFLAFVLIQLPPGDYVTTYIATLASSNEVVDQNTAAQLRERFGLDQPMLVQYLKWMWGILSRGDFGISFEWQQPVSGLIWERMALTLILALAALIATWAIALPIGVYSAVKKYSIGDYLFTAFTFLGLAIPSFLLALVLMKVKAVKR